MISHELPNSCILKLFNNWERVNKNIYHESNFNFIFLQELVKKMKTLILIVLLCANLYLSKISQLTLIFQKGSMVRKNFHSTNVDMNPSHGCIIILKKMSCCKQHVFHKQKANLALSPKKEDVFLSTGCSKKESLGKI